MNNKNTISILLIEDDTNACLAFNDAIAKRSNLNLIAYTSSSIDAIKILKDKNPSVIIVDIELHNGMGSGISFLKDLETINITSKPLIIVTTNIKSDAIYNQIHNYADIIFCKRQSDYSPDLVLDAIEFSTSENKETYIAQSSENRNELISKKINSELDKIGISYKHKGRVYIYEAILYLLTGNRKKDDFTVFQYLASKHVVLVGSIARAIQTAINNAWKTSALEDLQKYYSAKINYNTGVPTPTEFIYYYVDKISKSI